MIHPELQQLQSIQRDHRTLASEGGLTIASRIAAVYRDYPAAIVFLVGGSVARGCADGYSDLEIGIFWEGEIPTKERRDAITRLGGELLTMDRDGRSMEHFGLFEIETESGPITGYCMVSMNHNTITEMESILDAVLDHYETNAEYQELIFAVQHAVVLYGNDMVADWNRRAATFPSALSARIVQENLAFGGWFIPESYLLRDDPLILQRHFLTIIQHLIRLLLGLNRLYLPSSEFKWLDQAIARMTIAPPHLPERLREVLYSHDRGHAWIILKSLIYETLDLVDAHLPNHPEIDTKQARQHWNTVAPYTLLNNVGQQ